MKATVYNWKGETVGTIELSDRVWGSRWNPDLAHQALQAQVANRRRPIAHTKGRGEVSGGGKKPWRQKGTGRARQGSIRSPLWKGGGVSHGPTNERIFMQNIPKKMLRGAIHSALGKKLLDGEVRFLDSLTLTKPKTKELASLLKLFSPSALLVPAPQNAAVFRASRNLPRVKALAPDALNIEDVLMHKHILIDQHAASAIR